MAKCVRNPITSDYCMLFPNNDPPCIFCALEQTMLKATTVDTSKMSPEDRASTAKRLRALADQLESN